MQRTLTQFGKQLLLVALWLVCSLRVAGQTGPFEIQWTFDNTLSGVSTNANFIPSDATLSNGVSKYNLGGSDEYGTVSGSDQAFITWKTWPESYDSNRYLEVKFTPTTYEYNLTSLTGSFRRSGTGPQQITIEMIISKFNSSEDSIHVPLATYALTNAAEFSFFLTMLNKINQYSTYTFRFHGFGATNTNGTGTLWFNNITISGERTGSVLPVELTYFEAQAFPDRVELNWETAWERNSREFIVQRSSDLKEFGDIGRVEAAGQTDGRRSYSFTDAAPMSGTNYYRLRLVDQDDSYAYSKAKDVVIRPDQPLLLVSPNPVEDGIIRIKTFGIEVASLRLTSLLGQAIRFQVRSISQDTWELLPELRLQTGLYFLSGNQQSIRITTPFLVK